MVVSNYRQFFQEEGLPTKFQLKADSNKALTHRNTMSSWHIEDLSFSVALFVRAVCVAVTSEDLESAACLVLYVHVVLL